MSIVEALSQYRPNLRLYYQTFITVTLIQSGITRLGTETIIDSRVATVVQIVRRFIGVRGGG